ncbi:two-component system sensor histidine kinase ComP [Ureibacillus xyleni]|uniref:Two-component system sensor histidine kinase ComP n=1 Tax=Ureibacillus xyleni TaxID=614648 RepID=A0A285T6F4_9BACL|nr:PAS domain S-box protein [Ureibacillus xyleni]SOC16604.1 two-component system sensor histidine kinase ComP [Ureibacillus xyleni]
MKYNEEFFETILEYTSDAIMICDRNRHVVYITPNAYKISGYGPEEWKDRDTFFFLHPEDKEFMLKRHQNLLASKQNNSSEYRTIKKNGEIMYCECKTTPLPDTENYLQVVSMRDITERKLMEMDLLYHKNRHEVLQNSLKQFSDDLSGVMKLAEFEIRLLREIETVLPGSNPSILTSFPMDLRDGELVTVANKLLIKLGDLQQEPYILTLQQEAISDPMETIWLETIAHYGMMLFENLNIVDNLMVQLEKAKHQEETPQWMLRMIFNLQEQQRLTLSSDLHDTVLQDQIELYRRLESLLQRKEIEQEQKAKLFQIEQGLLDIIHEIRTTCNNLRPPLLRELGLQMSLVNLFDYIQLSSTYKIHFISEGLSELSLNEEETIGIYRMVQDLLHSAEESAAIECTFDFKYKRNCLKMIYQDNGAGFSDAVRLTSFRQRAKSLGGEVEMIPRADEGLQVVLTLPLTS